MLRYHHMSVTRYHTHFAGKTCQSIRGDEIDAAVARALLEAMRPAQLEVSMAAFDQVAAQARQLDRQWQLTLERARYEAELARRRFVAVEPENRLVARTLEREWNERLAEIERMERDETLRPQLASRLVDPEERCRVLALAQDLSKVWHAPTTPQTARKQLLGYLIKDVTLCRGETTIQVAIRWQTEACTVLEVPRPKRSYEVRRTDPVVVARIKVLAPDHTDSQIAALLDQEGFRSGTGSRFTRNIVTQLRYSYSIVSGCPEAPAACAEGYRADGRCSAKTAAEMLNVNVSTIADWCQSGTLDGIQSAPYAPGGSSSRRRSSLACVSQPVALGLGNRFRQRNRAQCWARPPSINPQRRCKEVQYERQIGMPSGLCLPSGLGMYTRRTGCGRYVSLRSSSASSPSHRSRPYASMSSKV